MQENLFKQQMRAFDHWKAELIQVIQDYHHWLNSRGQSSPELDIRLFDVIESLKTDHLTIAFVAEFSRGKTELINSIFFSDYKRRLLPSEAGRTTMCPTELFYDQEEEQAYIRLLPIETRLEEASISELKKSKDRWKTISLDINSPDQMVEALKEVVKTKMIPTADAVNLGLFDDIPRRRKTDAPAPETIEVPQWRHAVISFPHPLLQQGLAILDTPGLNALGTEPELTLNMLPNAHAVLFVLAADTGVTRSDLEMWEHHIKEFRGDVGKGLVAALNKIDTLWDEMKDDKAVQASISTQQKEAANALGIPVEAVFPVSAQKALLAKTKDDATLLAASRLPALEHYLASEIIPAKQGIIRSTVANEVGSLIRSDFEHMSSQFKQHAEHLAELNAMSGKNTTLIQHMMRKAREKQESYNKNMEYFQSSRRTLNQQAQLLLNELSLKKFDKLVNDARDRMAGSWTTGGLKTGMKSIFDAISETLQIATRHASDTRDQIIKIYDRFQEENDLPAQTPKIFSTDKYLAEMEKIYAQAEDYRTSTITTMTEQSFVIKKFFITLVSHARDIFFQANQEAETWFKDVMVPLAKHVTEHKQVLEQHMETLYKVNESKENLASRKQELEATCKDLRVQVEALQKMYRQLQTPKSGQDQTKPPAAASA